MEASSSPQAVVPPSELNASEMDTLPPLGSSMIEEQTKLLTRHLDRAFELKAEELAELESSVQAYELVQEMIESTPCDEILGGIEKPGKDKEARHELKAVHGSKIQTECPNPSSLSKDAKFKRRPHLKSSIAMLPSSRSKVPSHLAITGVRSFKNAPSSKGRY